MYLYRTV